MAAVGVRRDGGGDLPGEVPAASITGHWPSNGAGAAFGCLLVNRCRTVVVAIP
jgi:hypothetical protein